MASIAISPAVTSYGATGVAWSGDSVTLSAGQLPKDRFHAIGNQLEALHDGCVVQSIKVEFTGSQSSGSPAVSGSAIFGGVTAQGSLTGTPTVYDATGGAGVAPSVLRAGSVLVQTSTYSGFLTATMTITGVTVTVTYTDQGRPGMMMFSL